MASSALVGLDRLGLEDVERGAGDPALAQRLRQRPLVHAWDPRPLLMKIAVLLHGAELPLAHQVMRLGIERRVHGEEVRAAGTARGGW